MNIAKFRLLLAIFAIAACSEKSSEPAYDVSVLKVETDNRPIYRAVRDITYPPYHLTVTHGEHMGLEVDILNSIAEQQGFRIEYDAEAGKLFSQLEKRNIDILLGGTALSDVDLDIAMPTKPYTVSLDCLVAGKESDFNNWWKKTVAVPREGGRKEALMEIYDMSEKDIVVSKTHYQVMTEVLKGNVQIGLGDCMALRYAVHSDTLEQKEPLIVTEVPDMEEDDSTRIVFSVRKDQPELLAKINAGLDALQESGELDAIKKRWGQ